MRLDLRQRVGKESAKLSSARLKNVNPIATAISALHILDEVEHAPAPLELQRMTEPNMPVVQLRFFVPHLALRRVTPPRRMNLLTTSHHSTNPSFFNIDLMFARAR